MVMGLVKGRRDVPARHDTEGMRDLDTERERWYFRIDSDSDSEVFSIKIHQVVCSLRAQ